MRRSSSTKREGSKRVLPLIFTGKSVYESEGNLAGGQFRRDMASFLTYIQYRPTWIDASSTILSLVPMLFVFLQPWIKLNIDRRDWSESILLSKRARLLLIRRASSY